MSLSALYSDNSDGDRREFNVTRPFYALDTRWAAGGALLHDDKRSKLYQFGEAAAEYRHEREYSHLFGGWSRGIRNGRVWRWTAGVVHDDNRFSASPLSTLPSVVPADRKLIYPFLGLEIIEDGYVTAHNRDQIERTEDFQMGLQLRAALGWAATAFSSDQQRSCRVGRPDQCPGLVQRPILSTAIGKAHVLRRTERDRRHAARPGQPRRDRW